MASNIERGDSLFIPLTEWIGDLERGCAVSVIPRTTILAWERI